MRRSFFRAFPALILSSALAATSVVLAQDSDLLKRQIALQEIAKQKVSTQLKEAFDLADRMAATSTVRAVEHLRRLQISFENDSALPAPVRQDALTKVAERIRLIEVRRTTKVEPTPIQVNPKELAVAKAKVWVEEYQEVKRTLDTITALQKSGNGEQARAEAEALAKKYPNNPAVLTLNETSAMSQKLTDAKILQAQQAEGYRLAMNSVDKASIPPKDDLEFDTIKKGFFKEITKARLKSTLTAKEQELLKALDKPISIVGKESPFEAVIESISDKIGKPILLDKSSLQDADIQSSTPISTQEMRNISARTVLRKVLQDHGLTFIIKNETIQVMTLQRARETMVTRVYYIGDLVSGVGPFGNAFQFGPQLSLMQAMENANMIIQAMEKVDPLSWKSQQGTGSATFHAPSMSIIVRQSAEVHSMLSGAFSGR